MKITYKSKKLENSLTTDKGLSKEYGALAKKIKQRISQLLAAENLSNISKLPVLRLHAYEGNRKGEWSIDIFKNWRIIFEIDQDPIPTLQDGGVDLVKVIKIKAISVEDPH